MAQSIRTGPNRYPALLMQAARARNLTSRNQRKPSQQTAADDCDLDGDPGRHGVVTARRPGEPDALLVVLSRELNG
jgi:hypothetical protein